ncbi:MAG: ADP-ribosylglycohydrolase family protein [Paludibacteraceae bacterium]|nr:ADP-ribosylglycohydrolase family protein [Paludibacteraceae bacterium]
MNWLQKILSPSKSTQLESGIQRPLNQSYRVSKHLWAGEYPGDKNGETAKNKLTRMIQFGIRCFFDLTEEGELIPYENLLPPNVSYVRFPIRDVSVPQSIEDVRNLVKTILQTADGTHGEVYVHCWGGVGRTGTIIACLIAEGMENPTLEKVMGELRTRFAMMPKSSYRQTPETKEQEQFVQQYIDHIQNKGKNRTDLRDRIRGSLIGGAAGDALGYPVEFMSRNQVLTKYGSKGITAFELSGNGKALISDDTQMTLFTANGLLFGVTRFCTHGVLGAGLKDFVRYAYMDWYETQTYVEDYNAYHYCWIRDIAELNVRRASGNTCMSALDAIKRHKEVQNDSKGCGGVMRVTPVGLMAAADAQVRVKNCSGKDVPRRTWDNKEIVRLGGDCAELTHKHPLGYLPAAYLADLIYYIMMYDGKITLPVFEQFLHEVDADCRSEYKNPKEQKALDELWLLIEKAFRLASDSHMADEYAIPQLGEGWTGDEALAIALYCTMRHLDIYEDAIIAAVNHDGDSDSTGAICGNIMGTIVGFDGIPNHFIQHLELKDLIIDLADDLLAGCTISEYHSPSTPEEERWEKRYVKIEPTIRVH